MLSGKNVSGCKCENSAPPNEDELLLFPLCSIPTTDPPRAARDAALAPDTIADALAAAPLCLAIAVPEAVPTKFIFLATCSNSRFKVSKAALRTLVASAWLNIPLDRRSVDAFAAIDSAVKTVNVPRADFRNPIKRLAPLIIDPKKFPSTPVIIIIGPAIDANPATRPIIDFTPLGRSLNAFIIFSANLKIFVPTSMNASPIGIKLALILSIALVNLIDADSVSLCISVSAVFAN